MRHAGELQFSLLPIQAEDFEDFAKAEGEQGRIDEEELIHRADRHARGIRERQRLTEFKAEEQKAAYEHLEAAQESTPAPATLEDIWRVMTESPYLKSLGCGIESFRYRDAIRLIDVPGVPGKRLLTISRELFEHGLGQDDDRKLHFVTYGDPVFEGLLDHMLRALDGVHRAWHERTPLASVRCGGREFASSGMAFDFEPFDDPQIEPVERAVRPTPVQSDRG